VSAPHATAAIAPIAEVMHASATQVTVPDDEAQVWALHPLVGQN
jgi:hypothetical protein